MNANRRSMLKALGGVGTVVLAGCTGSGDGDGPRSDGNSSSQDSSGGDPDGWTEADLSGDVEYSFPEGGPIQYEAKRPAEVQGLNAFIQGQVLEVRGTLVVSENISQVVEISVEFQKEDRTSIVDTAPIRTGANEEHSFTVTYRRPDVDSITGFTLLVDGPEP